MSTFNSVQLITDLKKQTEEILQKAITEWQMMPSGVLLFKENETRWSAIQCLMHLNSYGRYYLPVIQTSIEEGIKKNSTAKETFTASFVGDWFTKMMLPKGEKQSIKKMKSPKEHVPVSNANCDVVLTDFIDQQEELLQLLEKAKAIDLRKAKTPVSISRFIKLPVGDTFRFMVAHNYRHVLQAERAIAAAREKAMIA